MSKPSIGFSIVSIENWILDSRLPPYEDCTDGSFESDSQLNKGDILSCDIEGNRYIVKVVASIPSGEMWKTFFDLI